MRHWLECRRHPLSSNKLSLDQHPGFFLDCAVFYTRSVLTFGRYLQELGPEPQKLSAESLPGGCAPAVKS